LVLATALADSPTCFSLSYSAILEAVQEVVDAVPVADMSRLARALTFAAESGQRVEREESDFESAILAGSRPTVSSFRPSSPAVDQEEGHIALREHRGKELVLVELCSSDV
jgi:hypothetical protein